MTDQEPRPRGKDFLIGFLSSLLVLVVCVGLVFAAESPFPLSIAFWGLVIAIVAALVQKRPFVSIGIFTGLVAVPLLLVGSCFAMCSGVT